MSIRIEIPRINDTHWDFLELFRCLQRATAGDPVVILDFSRCDFLRQNAVAFLGGLCSLIRHRGGTVHVEWATVAPLVLANLQQNGFCHHCGLNERPWVGNSIPFRHDLQFDPSGIITYLKMDWLGRGWIGVSDGLRDMIAGTVWEIYANAFEHSGSPIGVFSCGQFFPNLRELKLTVVDFGSGIPARVRDFFGDPYIPAAGAIQWAFSPGATTKPDAYKARGNGLDILQSFISLNNGKLEFYSGDGYGKIDRDGHSYYNVRPFDPPFVGTVLNFSFQCDDSKYCLASELRPVSFI